MKAIKVANLVNGWSKERIDARAYAVSHGRNRSCI